MKPVMERLASGDILFCDGAMGTFLQARGLQPGECPELWCLTHPQEVKEIHLAYRKAGSDIVECNSFGGTRYKLRHYGLEGKVREINRAAAALAREVAGDAQYVLGSMGPTGEFMEPLGDETEEAFLEAFRDQALGLEEGGADMAVVETMTGVEEVCVAVRAIRAHTRLVVAASFTFDPQPDGGYATMMGVTPERAVVESLKAGAHLVGANCGTGPDHLIKVIKRMKEAVAGAFVIAMPNAGMPVLENGKTVFKESPEQMAAKAPLLVKAGANIVGGCCGTGPEHIRAMKRAVLGG
jgi:5-methyltetrahydrofolate--homocysteine methyltransferase